MAGSSIQVSRNPAIDVFALGATLYCVLCGHPPWMGNNQIELATKMKNVAVTFTNESLGPAVKVRARGGGDVCLCCGVVPRSM
jgi:serine/threonine protein kinase